MKHGRDIVLFLSMAADLSCAWISGNVTTFPGAVVVAGISFAALIAGIFARFAGAGRLRRIRLGITTARQAASDLTPVGLDEPAADSLVPLVRTLRVARWLMPREPGHRWLREVDSSLFYSEPEARCGVAANWVRKAPRLIMVMWAQEPRRWARRRMAGPGGSR